jgi:hypothetical protein
MLQGLQAMADLYSPAVFNDHLGDHAANLN